jgi:hypothetical protein
MNGINHINDLPFMISIFVKTIKIILKLVEKIALNNKILITFPL